MSNNNTDVNSFPISDSSTVFTSNVNEKDSILIGKILEKLVTRAEIGEVLVLLLDYYGYNNQDDNWSGL
jgi:hypothetical protein